MFRNKLPSRRPCNIIKLMKHSEKYYVIIDYDPLTYEPRGLHCNGPKPGCDIWAILHEVMPVISWNIQCMKDPSRIGEFFKNQKISVLSDIIEVFVNEHKEWKKTQ
mgnify:FL=1